MRRILHRLRRALPAALGGTRGAGRATPLDDAALAAPLGLDDEASVKAAVRAVRDHTMVSLERLVSLWQQVRSLDRDGIPGALVECGVWRGGATGMMALAHLHAGGGATRALHLFDSFAGLPEPVAALDGAGAVAYAGQRAEGRLQPIGQCVGSLAENEDLLLRRIGYPATQVHFHAGWFEETVPRDAAAVGPVALLRLDGDWYASTRTCLAHLYAQVVPGGVVVIDDYGHWPGCRRAVDEFTAGLGTPLTLRPIDYTACYWIKP